MKKSKGVTLIALIVTIIVMLILLGVSIQILISSNILEAAKKAAQQTKDAYESEASMNDIKIGDKTFEEYIESLNGKKTKISWIYQENADGNIEITGLNLSSYSYTDSTQYDDLYTTFVTLGTDKIIIPDQLDGKNVVKLSLLDSVRPSGSNTKNCIKVTDVREIVFGNNITEFDFTYGGDMAWDSVFSELSVINFPNGINEALVIPSDKWGVDTIIISGEDRTLPWIYQENVDGNIEITGLDLSSYSYYEPTNAYGDSLYDTCVYIDKDIIVIPEKLDGKNVVKVSFTDSVIPSGSDTRYDIVLYRVEQIVIGNNVTEIDFEFEPSAGWSAESVLESSTIVNFPNGTNEALVIPSDKWGVDTIMISGVEYVPET